VCALSLALTCAARRASAFWFGACAVTFGVLIRETALAYFIILAGMALQNGKVSERLRMAVAIVVGFVVSVILIGYLAANRPSLFLANLLVDDTSAVYLNAFALDGIDVNAAGILAALGENVARNFAILVASDILNPEEYFVLGLLAACMALCLVRGLLRRDSLQLAVAAAGLLTFLLLMSTYKIEFFKGVRVLAFLWPALCIAMAAGIEHLRSADAVLAALLIFVCLATTQSLVSKRSEVCWS
jgi:hypothetical protein